MKMCLNVHLHLCLWVWPLGQLGRLEGLRGPLVAGCMLSVYGLFSSCDREQILMEHN